MRRKKKCAWKKVHQSDGPFLLNFFAFLSFPYLIAFSVFLLQRDPQLR